MEAAVEPILAESGLELVEVQYRRESRGWILRLFIDRAYNSDVDRVGPDSLSPGSSVTLDDCVDVSREVGRLLDVEEIVPGKYTLEVSSPGLDRPLTKQSDYVRFSGRQVSLKINGPEGRRKVKGRLLGLDDGSINLQVGDEILAVPYEQAERVQLVPEVDWSRA